MAETQLYHLGKNGPAPCGARKRLCRYAALPHGEEAQMITVWEKQNEEEHAETFLASTSKSISQNKSVGQEANQESHHKNLTAESLSEESHYVSLNDSYKYTEATSGVAKKVAIEHLSPVGYTEVEAEDEYWSTNGFSSVRRLKLSDGSHAYFKSVASNSERDEYTFADYGTSSLMAAVNEVNTYRLAQAMGAGYDELVPETSFTVYEGEMGTIQRESVEYDDSVDPKLTASLKRDYRKAVLFDFVIGNMDRHENNFLYTKRKGQLRMTLIDNSFTFPNCDAQGDINVSIFADNESVVRPWMPNFDKAYRIPAEELYLTEEEKDALVKAKEAVTSWKENGSISPGSMRDTIKRIDYTLESGMLKTFDFWYAEEMKQREESY